MGRRPARGRPAPPAHVAPDRPSSRRCDHAGRHAGPRGGGRADAGPARRRGHGLVAGVEDQPAGPASRRGRGASAGPRVPDARPTTPRRTTSAVARASTRTCSARTRRSRSTATSARRRESRRCCCRATPARSSCCRLCPPSGPTGRVTGLRARGGVAVDIAWTPHGVEAVLTADRDQERIVRARRRSDAGPTDSRHRLTA